MEGIKRVGKVVIGANLLGFAITATTETHKITGKIYRNKKIKA